MKPYGYCRKNGRFYQYDCTEKQEEKSISHSVSAFVLFNPREKISEGAFNPGGESCAGDGTGSTFAPETNLSPSAYPLQNPL